MHKRKEIKVQSVAILKAGLPVAEEYTVYKARYLPLDHDREFKAICVYTPDEAAEKMKSDEGYDRGCRVVISGYVSGKDVIEVEAGEDDIDELLDDISLDIENVLLTQYQTLNQTIFKLNLTGTQYFVSTEGDAIIGVAIMEFIALYKDEITLSV